MTVSPYAPLLIASGGTFKAWAGPARDVAEVFGRFEGVTIVWLWNGQRWDGWAALLPEALRRPFVLRQGDVLYIATDQFVAVPV